MRDEAAAALPLRIEVRGSIATLALLALALWLPGVVALWAPARAALVAVALFYLPGSLLARAAGLPKTQPIDEIAGAFALSIAMIVPAAALAFVVGGTAFVAAVVLVVLAAIAAAFAHRTAHGAATGEIALDDAAATKPEATTGGAVTRAYGERSLALVLVALTAALTVGAIEWTRSGSVDRFWYLGYVRAWAESTFQTAEPFLGSGHVHPRFAFNSWLAALAMWTKLARVDPVWLYERACPALLLPIAVAAQLALGRVLFGTHRGAVLTALCGALLWAGGGPVAVLSRAPEDKVLATIVLAPVMWSAVLRAFDGEAHARGRLVVAAGAAVALATVHPVTFIAAAAVAAVFASWTAARVPSRRSRAVALVVVLGIASLYPVITGALARSEYVAQGAAGLEADHPIARVHRGRARLIDAGELGYAVDPRILRHPVAIVAIAALALLPLRAARERRFLAPATLLPLAFAFVPPLAAAAGTVILPWMVHRLLWTLPLGALAAVAVDEGSRRLGCGLMPIVLVLIVASLPSAARAFAARSDPERAALAVPADPRLDAVLTALRELPRGSIVAAPPDLSERLTALTGVRVLAMSDRATAAFMGSREAAEARLRARAAVFAGMWKPDASVPRPSHVLHAPGAAAARYCGDVLHEDDAFRLCSFAPAALVPGIRLPGVPDSADGTRRVALADALGGAAESAAATCEEPPRAASGVLIWPRPSHWSAQFAAARCNVSALGSDSLWPRTLVLRPLLGRAVEELTVQAVGERNGTLRWRVRTRVRVHDGETVRFGLPRGAVDRVHIDVIPSFLPFVKLETFELTFEDAPQGAS